MEEFQPDKIFLYYQQLLSTTALTSPVTVVEKSRRTGYSWAAAAVAVFVTSPAENAQNTYYMGYDFEMAREFIQYVGEWAKKIGEACSEAEEYVFKDPDNPDKDIKAFRVTFANGKEVVALPSVARALRGKQGFVIIDEAAFHDDLREVLKAAFALLIWGGQVLIISTHNGEDNPFNDLIKDIRAGKSPYKLLRCTFDDALRQGLYKRICQKQGKEWSQAAEDQWKADIYKFYGDSAAEELDCIPANGSGNYFSRLIVEQCMQPDIPVLELAVKPEFTAAPSAERVDFINDWIKDNLQPVIEKMNPNLASGFGYDFGRSGDLSVCAVLQEDAGLNLKTAFVLEIRNMPHEQQWQIADYITSHLPLFRFSAYDARGNGSYLAEVACQKYGAAAVEEVMLSTQWYSQNMPRAKAYFEEKRVSLPQNANILNDFKVVKLTKGVPTVAEIRTKDEHGNKRHGDSCIAFVLGIYAMSKEGVPVYEGCLTAKDLADDDDEENNFKFAEGTY